MAFYIVVHHPHDPDPTKWANEWSGDEMLRTITTPPGVANRCTLARSRGERIFVHRCGWGGFPATIRCSVKVSGIDNIDKATALVRFSHQEPVGKVPMVSPQQGTNCYEADPPEGE